MTRYYVAIIAFALAGTAAGASRIRLEEGARARQTRIASRARHTCAVLDDGTVWCWGTNSFGQAGDGTTVSPKKVPVQVSGLNNIVSIATGASHTCALNGFGIVQCWGRNLAHQLGDGTTNNSLAPVTVDGMDKVVAIAAGGDTTCAIRAVTTSKGNVWCWGSNAEGELGTPGTFSTPVQPSLLTGAGVGTAVTAIAITVGLGHACAVIVDGTARCWGSNQSGELGNGSTSDPGQPVIVQSSLGGAYSGFVEISAGDSFTCGLSIRGTVLCWGLNNTGQLGDGSLNNRSLPGLVLVDGTSSLTKAVAVSAGQSFACALLVGGSVRCWGSNSDGRLGIGSSDTTPRKFASLSVVGLGNSVEIVTGTLHACAVEAVNWNIRCWGDNSSGQLGNGTTTASTVPGTVSGIAGSIGARSIAAGTQFNCARRGNGVLSCWGEGGDGQLGYGSLSDSSSAVNVVNFNDAIAVTAGEAHTCALHSTGIAACWGLNTVGQLGIGNTISQTQPVAVAGISNITQIATGVRHTCALLSDGTVACWGSNQNGQLGNGTTANSSSPVLVVAPTDTHLEGVVMITAGGFHTCALIFDGTVYCWGANSSGELGDAKAESVATVPVKLIGLSNIVAVSAGYHHTCAITSTGTASCWGRGGEGQLGNSANLERDVPDTVFGLSDAVAIAAGYEHTCAIRTEGSAVCWGLNTSGQLAAADSASHNAPVAVILNFATVQNTTIPMKLSFIMALAPGTDHTCASLGAGAVRCWGNNLAGQIGDGTLVAKARPTIVNSFTANVKPVVILKSNGRVATVTALLNCPSGGVAQIVLSLEQGAVSGDGAAGVPCAGGLVEVPLTVAARGQLGFQSGPAVATVEAIVREQGVITEDQHWTRNVSVVQ